jgi:hypothetical protein
MVVSLYLIAVGMDGGMGGIFAFFSLIDGCVAVLDRG